MLALVDAQALVDAELAEGVRCVEFIAGRAFHQGQFVGRVAVHLVGAGEDENRVRTAAARGLQQVEGAVGIDRKVRKRLAGCPVVRGLRRRVDYQRDGLAAFGKQRVHTFRVADVEVAMSVVGQFLFELGAVPSGRAVRAEKVLPHVVIHADDVKAAFVHEAGRLAADETRRAGD